jgi:hypothetical protein
MKTPQQWLEEYNFENVYGWIKAIQDDAIRSVPKSNVSPVTDIPAENEFYERIDPVK